MLAPLVGSLLLAGLPPACADDPIPRSVERSVVTSPRQPAATIAIGRDFAYAGCVPFELGGAARGTRYVFVDAEGSRLRRMMILHFEEFLPQSKEIYHYDMSAAEDIGGYRFRQNTFAFSGAPDSAPPGEAALTAQFLAAHGYDAPAVWLASRFVALGGPDRRSEFIVFYLEPAASSLTLGDLYHGEDETPAWHTLRKALADRSRQAFVMTAPAAAAR